MNKIPFSRYIWSTVLIAFGVLLFVQNLNLVSLNVWEHVWKFWPLFVIVPGVKSIFNGKIFWGSIVTLFGVAMIISNFTSFNAWGTIWPIFIILVGVSMLFRPNFEDEAVDKKTVTDDALMESAVFGGIEKRVKSNNFKGGNVDVVFGGGKLDLREINISGDSARLEVNAVFGGLEIYVDSAKYKVITKGTEVFGSWVDRSYVSKKDKPVLEISGTVVFGGVEIKE